MDSTLSKIEGKTIDDQSLLEVLAKGADYANNIYNLENLCNCLDKDTELVVLSTEFLVSNLAKKEEDKQVY